jgi:ParB family chromosome partitioning protein
MARKNLIEVSASDTPSTPSTTPAATARPLAGFIPPAARQIPIGGISKTLGAITEKVERAQDLEKQLAAGQAIVDLDPALIDASFIRDRIGVDPVGFAQLIEQIRDHGQQVPILVRPHPQAKGRYQVAYGHRRLAAAGELGRKVRAVVRDLTDDQLVVSQGQENNARTNLSYIERASFAARLEDRSFGRDVIMAALAVDKAALSKMIAVARQVPETLVEAIGAAPETGRRRWMEFASQLSEPKTKEILALLSREDVRSLTSDERFNAALEALKKKTGTGRGSTSATAWTAEDRSVSVALKRSAKKATLTLEAMDGPLFAEFIAGRLDDLYAAFRASNPKRGD